MVDARGYSCPTPVIMVPQPLRVGDGLFGKARVEPAQDQVAHQHRRDDGRKAGNQPEVLEAPWPSR